MTRNHYTVARTAIYPVFLLITLQVSWSLAFADSAPVKPELPLISWVQPEEWQEFGPISFRLPFLPEQEFMLIFPEALTARGMSMGSIRPAWTLEGDSARATFSTPDYTLSVIVRATSQPRNLATSQPRNLATSQPRNLATSQPRNLATSQPRNLATSQPRN